MKAYTTIRQFHERLIKINKDWNRKFKFDDPTPKDILLFNKRRQVCDRNLKILYRRVRLGDTTKVSLNELYDIHRQLTGEIMQISTIHKSWEFKAMLNQLYTVTEAIQDTQKSGMKLTFMMKVKVFLNRLKRGQIFTLFTKY